jgi:Flp pilus assembly protein TadG
MPAINRFEKSFRTRSVIRHFGGSRAGHAGIMFSILALPLILAIGFVIDFAQANKYKAELQNVADAVALAAVRGLPISETQGRSDGTDVYEALMRSIRAGLVTDGVTINFETTPDFKAIVDIVATSKGAFGNNLGLGTIRYEVNAKALLGRRNTEISLVLDLSGSMETARMKALGNALTTFETTVLNSPAAKDKLRIAAVPFAQSATLPSYAADWLATPAEKDYALAQGRTCFASQGRILDGSNALPAARPFSVEPRYGLACMTETAFALTDDFTGLRALATAFKNPPAWRSTWRNSVNTPYYGTNIFTGAAWASRFIDPTWAPSLPVGSQPEDANKANKYTLIMTDGEQLYVNGYTRAQADAVLLNVCTNLRNLGSEVFVIGFDVPTAAATMLRRCVTRPENYVAAANGNDLDSAFKSIAEVIGRNNPRLVY